jgi:hypothetical protein
MDPRVQVLTFALQNLDIDMQPIKKKNMCPIDYLKVFYVICSHFQRLDPSK